MRLLLVEDEKQLSEALKHILTKNKYTVDAVYNGDDGLDYALTGVYDVIILDIMLPKLSGFEVCKLLKTDNATWRIPVVVMSTLTDSESRTRAQEAGGYAG